MSGRDDHVPECLQCGACCHGEAGWVYLEATDDARVQGDAILRDLVEVTMRGSQRVHSLTMIRGVCGALRVLSGEVRCAGYASRPEVCRALERGSTECLAAIARFGVHRRA